MYNLKIVNGRANALLRAGNDFVKSNLSAEEAQDIIDGGKIIESSNPDYSICVDNKWFFESEKIIAEETPKTMKRGNKS